MSFLISSYRFPVGSGGSGPNTWNSSDKTSNISLSNGNLTATSTNGSLGGVRGTFGHSTGKAYFEATIDATASKFSYIGLLPASYTLPSFVPGNSIGGNDGVTVDDYGIFYLNGTNTHGTLSSNWTGAERTLTWRIAVDLTNSLFWARPTSGTGSTTWNFNGSADPATSTGGLSYLGGTILFIWAGTDGSGLNVTTNTGASSFISSVPSGFTAWDSL